MTSFCLLWHMHQPRYIHPATGRPALPWVRLHAASGYLDMARALERRPGVRVTVNFVPSLVEQLESMVAGARDALEEIAAKPAPDIDEADRQLLLARCFSVRHDLAVMPRPRYAELLAKRGGDARPRTIAEKARTFSTSELRDLQCLFLLAWLGFAAREDHKAIAALETKGQGFSEEDKRVLLEIVRAAAAAVLPAWRRLGERGQVELAASPYYHPILPLVIDTETARRSRPRDTLPPRFSYPEDAREQVARAIASHRRVFGAPPAGMWPSEGSLSPEAVATYHELGVRWLAADEETLERSSPGMVPGGGAARTRIWRHEGVDLVFRDRELSDRIGFRYADVPAAQAATDLVAAARARSGGEGLAGIFLDGENAWEAYPRRGADFLDALYARLEEEAPRVRARTLSEAIHEHGPPQTLSRLHSGSWIEATFKIWIGDPVKNEAWARLGRARKRVAEAERERGATDAGVVRARDLLLAAEGSDWFWWFGEPFTSAEDPVFDELFRAHLEAAYRALGDDPPGEVSEPMSTADDGNGARPQVPPARIHPAVDGKADRFYEWQGAVVFEIGRGGAMADSTHPIERLFVGFDDETLYLRLSPARRDRARVASARLVLRLRAGNREETIRVLTDRGDGGPDLVARGGRVGAGNVVELAIPLAAVGARARDELKLWLTLETDGTTFARVPRDGSVGVLVPWAGWEDENWSA